MDIDLAKSIVEKALAYSRALDESVKEVKDNCPDYVFQGYRREAGRVMGHLFTDLLAPIWNEHESLAPEWYKKSDGEAQDETADMSVEMRNRLVGLVDDLSSYLQSTIDSVTPESGGIASKNFDDRVKVVLEHVASARSYLESLDVDDDVNERGA